MSTFAAIKSRVGRYLIDLPTETNSEIGAWVNRAAKLAQDDHNFRFQEATAEFTTTDGTRLLGSVPSDWKEARAAPWVLEGDSETTEIEWITQSDAIRLYSDSALDVGFPRHVMETSTGFDIYPYPDGLSLNGDGEYRVKIPYWKYLPELSGDTDTNWFTDNAEDYLVYLATAEGMVFNRDEERAAVYFTKASEDLMRAVKVDKRSRLPKRITLRPMKGVYASSRTRR